MANIKTFETKKTGNTFVHNPDDPATLPVPHQMLLSEFAVITTDSFGNDVVRKSMQERELKVLFFLLHAVYEELEPGKTHEIDMHEMYASLRTQYGITNESNTWVWDSVKTLSKFIVEWVENKDDERWDCVGSLINYAQTNAAAREEGVLRFRFCNELVPVLREQSRFSKMRLHFLMSLSGKYSIILYGILEGLANQKHTNSLEVSIAELRRWLKISPSLYSKYTDFRKRVIEPALKQINKDPSKSGISISYEPKKRGRKTVALVFTVKKDMSRVVIDMNIKEKKAEKAKQQKVAGKPKKGAQRAFNMPRLAEMVDKLLAGTGLDKYAVIGHHEDAFRESIFKSGEIDQVKDLEAMFVGFLKKKKTENKL